MRSLQQRREVPLPKAILLSFVFVTLYVILDKVSFVHDLQHTEISPWGPNIALIVPLVLLPWWRKQWKEGLVAAVAFTVMTGGLFGAHLLITGEFNYQGGDRKRFVGSFPFDGGTTQAWDNPIVSAANASAR